MTRHYCTYFDHRYLPRGLAMARSLARWAPDAVLWVLCLDDLAFEAMSALKQRGWRIISLSEFERGDDALLAAKGNRSTIEYYFTLTPSLLRYVLSRVESGETATYLDSDLWFRSSPEPAYVEMGEASVAITPHRYPEALKHYAIYGLYNVGWLSIRNDACGNACATWWRERCLEWCYDRVEAGRFGDQGYLDRFGQVFGCVRDIAHPGVNLAPWNIARYKIELERDEIVIDRAYPLVAFHFHGLRRIGPRRFLASHFQYGGSLDRRLRRHLYVPYIREVLRAETDAAPFLRGRTGPALRTPVFNDRGIKGKIRALRRRWEEFACIMRGDSVRVR
jgi:hypothetical protein